MPCAGRMPTSEKGIAAITTIGVMHAGSTCLTATRDGVRVTLTLEGQQGAMLPVRLESRVTEIGTLELWCASRDGANRWKLELNIREKSA